MITIVLGKSDRQHVMIKNTGMATIRHIDVLVCTASRQRIAILIYA